MAGESFETAWGNVRNKLWPVLKANWCIWPLVQIINFKFVPVVHQLNFVLLVSLGWATYLSWSTSDKPATTDDDASTNNSIN
jgi:protein Mpv17